ncbi:ABC transporter substrate-binding protein [Arenibaculum pallidiluteum]|uniref:ABC transporter substrate-binding protein n=1 Tax=Arenibaculum pallidiluteum TaxID=2812559 RepID=UPI001A977E48|nr:ABC transporter substrate-binding protein [Arenibaculum pallidiluteum]
MPSLRIATAAAFVSLLALGSSAGWAQAPKRGGTVHAIVTPEPPMLMQGLSQTGPTNMVAGNIYESLLRFDEKLNPQPSLARSWEVTDGAKVYTFKLQPNVKWHDGKPFSAEDVVFTLDKFLREVHPRWRPIANAQVEKIEQLDAETVRITLKQPFGPLLFAMEVASAPIVPKHVYEGTDYKANPMNNTPIGTGPFKLKEWKRGSYIHLVRNEDYWIKDKPALDEVFWQIIPDAASRAVAYETGKVDVLTGGSVDIFDVPRLAQLPNTCVTTKGWEMFAPHAWITVNHRNGILGNKQFRQGLMHAIDREFGKDVVWNGYGKIPTGPISSKTKFYSDDVKKYDYDVKKARDLIKQSGYKGETIKFLALPYGETWTRWAEAVKQNFAEVGVNLEIVTTDVPGWVQKTSDWDFDLTFNFLYQLGDPAIGVSRSYVSSNIAKGNPFGNVGGYSNPEADKFFADAAVAATEAERQTLYTKVQQILAEDLPVLWLLEMDFPTIHRCNVKNLVTTAIGVNDGFRDAWKE